MRSSNERTPDILYFEKIMDAQHSIPECSLVRHSYWDSVKKLFSEAGGLGSQFSRKSNKGNNSNVGNQMKMTVSMNISVAY